MDFVKENNLLYADVSALSGNGIEKCFISLAKESYEYYMIKNI